jgi:hypothetical protein
MRYYGSLGETMPNEQLAINAQMAMSGKGGNLAERQVQFTQDIVSSYQMLMQLDEWDRQFGPGAKSNGQLTPGEKSPALISNSPSQADTQPK